MTRAPFAEWVPWKYLSNYGPTYYKGLNTPIAVVLHRMQGYYRTAIDWARSGHFGASWHFSVALDGRIAQHLVFQDGGYHAGITISQAEQFPPNWPLFKHPSINVNTYTIGVECEGFAGQPWPPEQMASLKRLCRWLSEELGIPIDKAHFPPHADIDIVNRVNDFDYEGNREVIYRYLMEDEMTPEEVRQIVREVVSTEDIEMDDRLRTVMVKRIALINIATEKNPELVEQAYDVLKEEGFDV